jgi:hypothetical protein
MFSILNSMTISFMCAHHLGPLLGDEFAKQYCCFQQYLQGGPSLVQQNRIQEQEMTIIGKIARTTFSNVLACTYHLVRRYSDINGRMYGIVKPTCCSMKPHSKSCACVVNVLYKFWMPCPHTCNLLVSISIYMLETMWHRCRFAQKSYIL